MAPSLTECSQAFIALIKKEKEKIWNKNMKEKERKKKKREDVTWAHLRKNPRKERVRL